MLLRFPALSPSNGFPKDRMLLHPIALLEPTLGSAEYKILTGSSDRSLSQFDNERRGKVRPLGPIENHSPTVSCRGVENDLQFAKTTLSNYRSSKTCVIGVREKPDTPIHCSLGGLGNPAPDTRPRSMENSLLDSFRVFRSTSSSSSSRPRPVSVRHKNHFSRTSAPVECRAVSLVADRFSVRPSFASLLFAPGLLGLSRSIRSIPFRDPWV